MHIILHFYLLFTIISTTWKQKLGNPGKYHCVNIIFTINNKIITIAILLQVYLESVIQSKLENNIVVVKQ